MKAHLTICAGVLSVLALTAAIAAPPEPAAAYSPDEMHVVLGFTVEIQGAGGGTDVDSAWETCTGGSMITELKESTMGDRRSNHKGSPGGVAHTFAWDALRLTGELGPRDLRLFQSLADVRGRLRETVRIHYTGQKGRVLRVDEYDVSRVDLRDVTVVGPAPEYRLRTVQEVRLEVEGARWGVELLDLGERGPDSVFKDCLADGLYDLAIDGDERGRAVGFTRFDMIAPPAKGEDLGQNDNWVFEGSRCTPTGGGGLYAWLSESAVNRTRVQPRDISVICLKRDGSEARRFNCLQCIPIRYTPPQVTESNVACETVVCKMGRVELQ